MAGGDSPERKLVWQALLEGSDAQERLGKVLIWEERGQRAVKVKVNVKESVWLPSSNPDWCRVSCPLAAVGNHCLLQRWVCLRGALSCADPAQPHLAYEN